VLNVVALGETRAEARDRAYAACERIRFEGRVLRTDIAREAVHVELRDAVGAANRRDQS
jgi:phosphoribosylamine--glycine ligase